MRDLLRILIVGFIISLSGLVYANEYKVIVLPDNVVNNNDAIDSYIYNATSEFFAGEVINILNQTDYIKSPTVSEERKLIKNSPSIYISTKNCMNQFKTTYNIDYSAVKKVASQSKARYVVLLTSTIDSENYILRRTVWDFLNIPGATVVDPAYKINTYVVLIDTERNFVLWSNTFYKTISTVENRIITRGPSPQTEQLNKIRDYSRMLCPEIAQNIQLKVLPANIYSKESKQIYYDMANFDNVFTKKYRRWHKEFSKDYARSKEYVQNKKSEFDTKRQERKQIEYQKNTKIDIVKEKSNTKTDTRITQPKQYELKTEIYDKYQSNKTTKPKNNIQNINFIKRPKNNVDSAYKPIEVKYTKKNNLIEELDTDRPDLRGYN